MQDSSMVARGKGRKRHGGEGGVDDQKVYSVKSISGLSINDF